MGLLVEGTWQDHWYDTEKTQGEFVRKESSFRNWITQDGSAGPSGTGGFKAEAGRYHLIVSYACPWAHRALIFRVLKGLQGLIDVSAVQPLMLENGWEFDARDIPPFASGLDYLYQLYQRADQQYTGRVTVPLVWDRQRETIVSNESAEIIRMLNSAFNELTGNQLDFYPSALRTEIDEINHRVYHAVNNGVYRAGFATRQSAYESAFNALFSALDWLEERLSRQRYLVGTQITEADWRLFTTLVRFDAVYFGHFKCNLRRIVDFPNLAAYLRELYQHPGIADTVHFDQIKTHYYASHRTINPTVIVPTGPQLDLDAAHQRDLMPG